MTQIRLKENMTRDEALMLLEVANREVEMLNQRLAEQEEAIEQLEETNAALRDENRQLKMEMEAIGAGGVSSQRITGKDALQSQDREDAERLDWLLCKLPGDAIRYCVGVLDDTADAEEFRAAIDHARRAEGGGE